MRPHNVCVCMAVSKKEIIKVYNEQKSYSRLIDITGATEGCGTCENDIKEIINKIK